MPTGLIRRQTPWYDGNNNAHSSRTDEGEEAEGQIRVDLSGEVSTSGAKCVGRRC